MWKNIVGYNGRYQIAMDGRVRTASGQDVPTYNKNGVMYVDLNQLGATNTHVIKRLVNSAFL